MNRPRITTANEDNTRYAKMLAQIEDLTATITGRCSKGQIDNLKMLYGYLVAISNDFWIYFDDDFKDNIEIQRKDIRLLLHGKLTFKDGDGVLMYYEKVLVEVEDALLRYSRDIISTIRSLTSGVK